MKNKIFVGVVICCILLTAFTYKIEHIDHYHCSQINCEICEEIALCNTFIKDIVPACALLIMSTNVFIIAVNLFHKSINNKQSKTLVLLKIKSLT